MSDLLGDYGSLVGGAAAAGGLIYTGLQLKSGTGQRYLELLNQFSTTLESLEASQIRNEDHTQFAIKYINNLDRMAYLAIKRHVDKAIVRQFNLNFKAALGLFEMDEYKPFRGYAVNLIKWCDDEKLVPDPPPLPYPDISITTSSGLDPQVFETFDGCFVTWISLDSNHHSVTSLMAPHDPEAMLEFSSPEQGVLSLTQPNRAYAHRFDKRGEYQYFCKHHSSESGKIVVKRRV